MRAPFARPLLATEHTEFDAGAEALALEIARRCALPLAVVMPVLGNPEFDVASPQLAARADAEAAARREALESMARTRQVSIDVTVRHGSEPHQEIVDEARRRGADLIVIRRRGRRGFLAQLLVGEMVGQVVAQAPCSVLIAPRQATMWSRRVMVAIEPSAPDEALIGLAAGIAADCGLPLRLVCVAPSAASRADAERVLAAAAQKARAICTEADTELREGTAHQALVAAARACDADLLVLARHGGDRAHRTGLGSTVRKVVGLAESPVLVHVPTPITGGDTR